MPRALLKLAATLSIAWLAWPAMPAFADYADRPVTAIVPFAAGGAVDLFARLFTPHLSRALGQPVVVENKPGADAIIGITAVATAKPDGYTILFSAGAERLAPALHRKLPYDPVKQIVPIAELAYTPNAIAVSSKLGVSTVAELVTLAKRNPGKLNAAVSGNGGRMSVELFKIETGTQIAIVSFSGGGQVITSLMGGETDLTISDSLSFAAAGESDKMKVLAVAGDRRVPAMPKVPTTTEAGFPDFKAGTVYGVYTTGGVPDEVVRRLYAEFDKIVANPDVVRELAKIGVEPSTKTQAAFRQDYLDQLKMWKELVDRANIPTTD